jgi:hypothetical protein
VPEFGNDFPAGLLPAEWVSSQSGERSTSE